MSATPDAIEEELTPEQKKDRQDAYDRYAALVGARLGVDFVSGNYAHATQMRLAQAFASRLFGPKGVSRVDDIIDGGTADVLRSFSGSPAIHLAA